MRKIESLREMQMIELDILLMFDSYCREHNLNYSVYGGTMLGAVRHSGFIPWDDDIDLCMERPEYEKLVIIVKDSPLPTRYKLYAVGEPGYAKPFIKIVDLHTRLKQKENESCSGVWIDIFPLDGTPRSEIKCIALNKCIIFLQYLLQTSVSSPFKASTVKNKICKLLLFPVARGWGAYHICKCIDALAQKFQYNRSKFVGNLVWNRAELRTRYYRDLIDGYGNITFENHEVMIHNNWETVLFNLYGNYHILPDEKSRILHPVEAYVLDESEFIE